MLENIVIYVGSALISGIVALILGRKQGKKMQVDIESQYKTMLDSEIKERRQDRVEYETLSARVDKLEKELRRVWRAYEYSLRHIKRVDPDNPPPDFLEWSTGELQKYYKERFGE